TGRPVPKDGFKRSTTKSRKSSSRRDQSLVPNKGWSLRIQTRSPVSLLLPKTSPRPWQSLAALFFRCRHQPRTPPQAKIRAGSCTGEWTRNPASLVTWALLSRGRHFYERAAAPVAAMKVAKTCDIPQASADGLKLLSGCQLAAPLAGRRGCRRESQHRRCRYRAKYTTCHPSKRCGRLDGTRLQR